MTTSSERRIFGARRDQLALATAFVEDFCERQGVAPGDALRLTLIVEELFTNTILHGHRGDNESPVRIELGVGPTQLTLRFEDSAPPFDPLQYLASAAPRLDAPAAERQVGGLGLPLVARMAERFEYAHVDGFNRLTLRVRRET